MELYAPVDLLQQINLDRPLQYWLYKKPSEAQYGLKAVEVRVVI